MSTVSITATTNGAQGDSPLNSGFPVANSATNSPDQSRAEQTERTNKYLYPEFEGIAGERYLLALAEQFAPLALWRTWYACVSYQAPGNPCYVGVGLLVDARRGRVGVKERKIYLDLAALEERGWLTQSRARMPFVQEHGNVAYYPVTVKDFTGFYEAAHDYHLWLHDPAYLPPERENVLLMLEDQALVQRLLRFENYRRLLLCGKPGRKPREEPQDIHPAQLARLAAPETSVPKVNQYFNQLTNTVAPYRRDPAENKKEVYSSSDSTSGREIGTTAATIRNTSDMLPTEPGTNHQAQGNLSSKSNPQPNENKEQWPSRAEAVQGYTEQELQQDRKKRGAAVAGIPAEHYARLTGEPERERKPARPAREIPALVVEVGEQYARCYDDAHLVQSDVTRFKKVYATASQARAYFDEALYWKLYDQAKEAAGTYASKRKNSKGRVTRVPYLLTCLENACSFSLEELVYLRTENPLYTDYTLWDAIDYLRETYQQQERDQLTQHDYREWLQCLLDELEHCEKPKDRNNVTARDY